MTGGVDLIHLHSGHLIHHTSGWTHSPLVLSLVESILTRIERTNPPYTWWVSRGPFKSFLLYRVEEPGRSPGGLFLLQIVIPHKGVRVVAWQGEDCVRVPVLVNTFLKMSLDTFTYSPMAGPIIHSYLQFILHADILNIIINN